MSRDGFAIADFSTGHFDDPKVRALWRLVGDVDAMCRAMTMHQATVLGSWLEGRRLSVDEAVPIWLPADANLVNALRTARLLDKSGRVPTGTWKRWFEPAFARREAARAAGREGNRKRWNDRESGGESGRDRVAIPVSTVSTVSTDRPSRGRRVQSTNGKVERVGNLMPPFEAMVGKASA